MDENDLEVLDCSETPEPSEQTSNIVDVVAYNILLTINFKPILTKQ